MSSSFHWVYRPMWFILGGVEVLDFAFGMVDEDVNYLCFKSKGDVYVKFKLRMTMIKLWGLICMEVLH